MDTSTVILSFMSAVASHTWHQGNLSKGGGSVTGVYKDELTHFLLSVYCKISYFNRARLNRFTG